MQDESLKEKIVKWIHTHDDCWFFVIAYIGLAVVLSTFISLFWLIAIVIFHGIFELIKFSSNTKNTPLLIKKVLWEIKLDIALIFFSFVIHLYLGFAMGVAGIGGISRAGAGIARAGSTAARATSATARTIQTSARVAPRVVIIQRTLRAGLMMLDEAILVLRGIFFGNKSKKEKKEYKKQEKIKKDKKWSFGDWFTVSLGIISIILIFLAPVITEHDTYRLVLLQILEELHPFP